MVIEVRVSSVPRWDDLYAVTVVQRGDGARVIEDALVRRRALLAFVEKRGADVVIVDGQRASPVEFLELVK